MKQIAEDLRNLADALEQLPDTNEWVGATFMMQSDRPVDGDELWAVLDHRDYSRRSETGLYGDRIARHAHSPRPLDVRIVAALPRTTERERLLARLAELDGQVA